ncbi:Rieske (2Fe-2S) protein [Thermomonospora echinospora]|nr:Rieske (2Fe-2S) protein [Thermomonospora echinospora]
MSNETTGEPSAQVVGRRAVVCGAGVVGAAALAGCGGGGGRRVEAAADLKGKEVAKVADVPVGGGKVVREHKVVVTQPAAGTFKVFDARCTHSGCPVDRIRGGRMYCPCHGSEFELTDGSVAQGPASRALLEYPVQVRGDGLVIV